MNLSFTFTGKTQKVDNQVHFEIKLQFKNGFSTIYHTTNLVVGDELVGITDILSSIKTQIPPTLNRFDVLKEIKKNDSIQEFIKNRSWEKEAVLEHVDLFPNTVYRVYPNGAKAFEIMFKTNLSEHSLRATIAEKYNQLFIAHFDTNFLDPKFKTSHVYVPLPQLEVYELQLFLPSFLEEIHQKTRLKRLFLKEQKTY